MTDICVPRALIQHPQRFGGTPSGDCLRGSAIIRDGKLVALGPQTDQTPVMVLPHLVEAHCHLDKCHTIERLGTVGGDLIHAIQTQIKDKDNWSAQDLRTRAARGLKELHASGCRAIRTHVDWGDDADPPTAWGLMGELAQDVPHLQRAALTGIAQWSNPDFADPVAKHIAASQGIMGAFVFNQPGFETGLQALFAKAIQYDLPLDFHVDEGLGNLNGLEVIADTAIATGYTRPILCGHAVSLMDRNSTDLNRIIDKLLRANITICALPVTNLYLQGRTIGTPDRRGITRLRELHAAGVPITVASDNVGDAFCPTGAHDPMAALALASITAHLDPPLDQWLPAITTNAAAALGHAPTYVDGAYLTDLLVANVTHTADLIAGRGTLTPAEKALT